ncbi:MAG: DNA polymerase III subunit gamma/tau [Treponema sp.]|jgi:DNA polymerase-3 subunit gamma/tau|nr:DNA polymerase III subunit gamma/tau [Treponema sp.]
MTKATTPVYEVTAAKYRPKTFDELAGQEFVVSTIRNSLKSGHIAHAYLFSGPRGCGKTSAARILARSLNCEKAVTDGEKFSGNPCGGAGADGKEAEICDNCRAISQGASMDVIEIDGASNNSVNDVRQIKDEVLFPPQSGRYKVYIIDEVHMLSGGAFNALLKTIEEPPPYIIFIFATTELHKVPATIKSRCQQFNFRLIPVETIQGILKKICVEMKIEAEDNALFWIARESTGSMRDAFTLFDQVVSFSSGSIRGGVIREKLGITGLEKLNALAETCAANDAPGAFALTDEIIGSGVAIEQFIIDLAGYYRSLLLIKNGITRESLLGYPPAFFSAKALETYDSTRLEQALDILLDCHRNTRFTVSPRFELETAVSKLTWLSRWISQSELKEAMDNAQDVLLHSGSAAQPRAVKDQSGNTASERLKSSTAPANPKSGGASGGDRSLSDDLMRVIAAKENTAPAEYGTPEEEDFPMWDSVKNENSEQKENTETEIPPGPEAQLPEHNATQLPEQVERVLSFFPGTIVE